MLGRKIYLCMSICVSFTFFALVNVFIFGTPVQAVEQTGSPQVSIKITKNQEEVSQVAVGDAFDVSVAVSDVDELFGASFDLVFDPSMIKVLQADGTMPAQGYGAVIDGNLFPVTRNKLDSNLINKFVNEVGTVTFATTLLGDPNLQQQVGENVDQAILGTVRFKALKAGTVSFNLLQHTGSASTQDLSVTGSNVLVHLCDVDVTPVPFAVNNAAIKIADIPVEVIGITLDKTNISLTAGHGKANLIATIVPENATNKSVKWTSSAPKIASVTADGLNATITPLTEGMATIKVTTDDGNKIATCTVIVNPNNIPPVYQKWLTDSTKSQVMLIFDENLVTNVADLKSQVTFAADGENFLSLGPNDEVSIVKNAILIRFDTALSGITNRIMINPNALKDNVGNVLKNPVITGNINADIDECFIATASYGSKFEPAVVLLREFRDRFLLTNLPGKVFVQFYYQQSPPIAKYIAHNEALKLLVRIMLTPVVSLAYLLLHPLLMCCVLGAGIMAIYLRRKRKAMLM